MAAVALLVSSAGASWADERIGGAEIIIDGVQGQLSSGSTVPVSQGDGVYRDEGVRTRVDSKARLGLEDQTNVTIGPSSTVKLDRFVYAGAKRPGTIVLNLAEGTCRLVPLHRGFDGLKFNGGLGGPRARPESAMLRATPAVRLMRPARSRVSTI